MDYYDAKREIAEACEGFTRASSSQIRAFKSLNKGGNFMTPDVMAWLSLENRKYVAEISLGSGINSGTYIYGVTVIERESGQWVKSKTLSKCCHSGRELKHYLSELDSEDGEAEEDE